MNDHDLNLIIDLASGALEGAAAEGAMAHISASPELMREYELQVAVIEALAAVQPASMTVEERTDLHAQVAGQLNVGEARQPRGATAGHSRRRWWAPAFGLAATAAVVVAFVVAPGLRGASDDDLDTAAMPAELTSTTAPGAVGGEGFISSDGIEESATSQMSAPESTDEDLLASTTIGDLYRAVTENKAKGVDTLDMLLPPDGIEPAVVEECVASLGAALPEGEARLVGVARDGTSGVLAVEDGSSVVAVAVVDLTSCTLIDIKVEE